MNRINTNKSIKLALAGVLTLLVSSANAAVIDGIGTHVGSSNYSNCPSYCNGNSFSYDLAGAEGQLESYIDFSANEYGSGQAYASFTSDSFMPLLRVKANSIENSRTSATAFSVQNFTNTGTETKTVELNVNLHGSVSDNSSGSSDSYLSASIAILSGRSLDWYPSFATLVYEVGQRLMDSMGNYIDPMQLNIDDGVDVNNSDILTFEVNAGESFYIVSQMLAASQNGYVDAWNTLSMDFKDGSNLQAATAPVSVPEPKTMFLFAFCLVVILVKKRDLLF